MNIDDRINELMKPHTIVDADTIKQLIHDVLEYVKPEHQPMHFLDVNGADLPINHAIYTGMNRAIDDMEAKIKELGL